MDFISKPRLETNLTTQTVLYPALRQLVRFLTWDHQRVMKYLQDEAKQNPFLMDSNLQPDGNRETLIEDVRYHPAASGLSLQEHLYGQISALSISAKQQEALIYLTQWLSPSGYLEATPETWAAGSVWSPQALEAVVPILQSLDPPGVGARSLRECLLLQLEEQSQSLPALLVRDYLEEIANCTGDSPEARRHCEALLQKLKHARQLSVDVNLEILQAAIRQIQALEPRPGRNFSHSNAPIVTPDLKAELGNTGEWQVLLVYEPSQRFCLNQEALQLLQQPQQSADKRRLEALLQKARSLMTAMQQWQENLLKVGQFLVERQQAFLNSQDALDLIPTPQQIVAQALGISEATVSRIVRGRYLLVCLQPSRTIPLASLCVPITVGGRTPQQVQQLLKQLIEDESPTQPYSDEQLAQLLKLRFGLSIARRTVAKYRKIIGIEPAYARRL